MESFKNVLILITSNILTNYNQRNNAKQVKIKKSNILNELEVHCLLRKLHTLANGTLQGPKRRGSDKKLHNTKILKSLM